MKFPPAELIITGEVTYVSSEELIFTVKNNTLEVECYTNQAWGLETGMIVDVQGAVRIRYLQIEERIDIEIMVKKVVIK